MLSSKNTISSNQKRGSRTAAIPKMEEFIIWHIFLWEIYHFEQYNWLFTSLFPKTWLVSPSNNQPGCHRFGVLYAVCVFCVCAIPIWLSLGLYCCIGGYYLYIARRGFFRLGRQYSWCPISLVLVFELLGAECAVAGLAHSDCEWPWFVYLCRYQFICGCWVAFCCGDYLFWWGRLRWFVVVCYLVGGFAPVLCLVSMVSNLLVFVFFYLCWYLLAMVSTAGVAMLPVMLLILLFKFGLLLQLYITEWTTCG